MKCDELKAFDVGLGQYTEDGYPCVVAFDADKNPRLLNEKIYLKSEADKVIALLKDKANYNEFAYKLKSEELSDTCRFYEDELRHNKYKRCEATAKWCNERHTFNEPNEKRTWLHKWHKRWLKIAKKFKDK